MKLLVVIFSVYFLVLNLMPCQDGPVAEDTTQAALVQQQGDEHDHGQCESDLCSTFCGCHCCHSHTIDFGLVPFEPFQPPVPQMSFAHFDSLGKDFSLSLFQPPRI